MRGGIQRKDCMKYKERKNTERLTRAPKALKPKGVNWYSSKEIETYQKKNKTYQLMEDLTSEKEALCITE